jgi:hypothetical protein
MLNTLSALASRLAEEGVPLPGDKFHEEVPYGAH